MSKENVLSNSKWIWILGLVLASIFAGYAHLHWKPEVPSRFSTFIDDGAEGIAYSEDIEPPLEHIQSGFKCLSIVGEPVFETLADVLSKTNFRCQWGWQYEVRNKLSVPVEVEVEYQLEDEDGFVRASSSSSIVIKADGVGTIKKIADESIDLQVLQDITYAGWTIGFKELRP